MKKNFLKAKIVLRKDENRITVIASDETLDRHGDVLPIESWDLSKFKLAPRMLVDHDHRVQSIVGKWKNPRIEGKELLMDADFHGITELSKAVQEMVEKGYLDTVSVGFIFNGPDKDGGKPTFELIETSWVTVPANPSARVQNSLASTAKSLLEKDLTEEEKNQVEAFAGETKEDEDPDLEDEEEDTEEAEPEIDPATGEPKIEPEEDADELDIPEEDEEEDKIFDSISEVKDLLSTDSTLASVNISVRLLNQLIADSEKLLTLTDAEKSAETMKIALKEAAHIVNDSLRKLNRAPIIG